MTSLGNETSAPARAPRSQWHRPARAVTTGPPTPASAQDLGACRTPGAATTSTTTGRPVVSVPVLSITNVVAWPRLSSAPPLRITTPAERPGTGRRRSPPAPRAVAGMGSQPRAPPPPVPPTHWPATPHRPPRRHRHEIRRVAVSQSHDRRAFGARLLRQPHDPGVGTLLGGRRRTQLERGPGVDHTAAHRLSAPVRPAAVRR